MHVENNSVCKTTKNGKAKHLLTRIHTRHDQSFLMFLQTRHNYESKGQFLTKLVSDSTPRWVKNYIGREITFEKPHTIKDMEDIWNILDDCFHLNGVDIKEFFPKKERFQNVDGFCVLNNGNFRVWCFETELFYYAICYAQS